MANKTGGDLAAVLATVRGRIERARDRGATLGEQDTKATLIEPILAALGWRVDSIDDVRREYRSKPQDNPVDYALFIHRTPRLFIEAKALEKDPSDRKWIGQTLSYATMVGVEWCVLTNGDEYRLYNAHAPVDVEEKLFRAIRITDPDDQRLVLETLDLLSKDKTGENLISILWKAQFVDHHVQAALREILSGDDAGLVRLIRRRTKELKPAEIRESLRRAEIRVTFPMLSVADDEEATEEDDAAEERRARKPAKSKKKPKRVAVEVADLIKAGLVKPPLELEKDYKGVHLTATVLADGRIQFGGEAYDSLSTAGGMARRTVIGKPPNRRYPQTNGWTFWQFRDPASGELKYVDELRQAYLESEDASETPAGKVLPFKAG